MGAGGRTDIPTPTSSRSSLANGALIGFGVGAGLGLVALAAEDARSCDPGVLFDCSNPNAGGSTAVSLISGGLGAAIGVGIDALIRRDRGIYRRGRTRVTLSSALAPGIRVAVLGVSW